MIFVRRTDNIYKLGFVIIKGYKRYAINKNGDIISLYYNSTSNFYKNVSTTKEKGYIRVKLINDKGVRKNILVHRLVAETFIPNPNNYVEINHKDYNRANNSVDNLEWCTKSYNMRYSSCNRHYTNPNKIKIKRINIVDNTVDIFESLNEAAKKCHVTFNTIYKSLHNKDYIAQTKYKFRYVF